MAVAFTVWYEPYMMAFSPSPGHGWAPMANCQICCACSRRTLRRGSLSSLCLPNRCLRTTFPAQAASLHPGRRAVRSACCVLQFSGPGTG
jgi:hypothetical protein